MKDKPIELVELMNSLEKGDRSRVTMWLRPKSAPAQLASGVTAGSVGNALLYQQMMMGALNVTSRRMETALFNNLSS